MAGEFYDFSTINNSNQDTDKSGLVEGMKRSDVNNRVREIMGALRRWYRDGEWTRQLEEQLDPITYTYAVVGSTVEITSVGGNDDVSALFTEGTRCRVSEDGTNAVEGIIGVATYNGSGKTTVPVSFPPIFQSETEALTAGTGTIGNATSLGLDQTPIVPGSVVITDDALHTGGRAIRDPDGDTILKLGTTNVGTIDYSTGLGTVNGLAVGDEFDADVLASYQYTEELPPSGNRIEIYLNRTIRDSAFREVGPEGGKVVLYEDFGGAAFKQEGAGGGLDSDTVDGFHATDLIGIAAITGRNYIANPAFGIAQRGDTIESTSWFNNDSNSYTLDRWKLLSQVNDAFDVIRLFDGPPRVRTNAVLRSAGGNEGAPNSKEGGLFQILSVDDTISLEGLPITFSFYAQQTGTLDIIDACILGYTGSLPAPNTDLVAAWNGSNNEPDWLTDWQRVGSRLVETPGYVGPTGAWKRYILPSVTVPEATYNHLAVGIWVNDNDFSVGDELRITGVQLELSSTGAPFHMASYSDQLLECMRYFQKTFPQEVAPQQDLDALLGGTEGRQGSLAAIRVQNSANHQGQIWRFATPLQRSPEVADVVTYNPTAADANWSDGTVPDGTGVKYLNTTSLEISNTNNSAPVNGARIHATVEVEL